MPHPTKTRKIAGHTYHLEDSGLKRVDANALKTHLRKTEDKRARVSQSKDGTYGVWWAKK
jgi:hypothetical protein